MAKLTLYRSNVIAWQACVAESWGLLPLWSELTLEGVESGMLWPSICVYPENNQASVLDEWALSCPVCNWKGKLRIGTSKSHDTLAVSIERWRGSHVNVLFSLPTLKVDSEVLPSIYAFKMTDLTCCTLCRMLAQAQIDRLSRARIAVSLGDSTKQIDRCYSMAQGALSTRQTVWRMSLNILLRFCLKVCSQAQWKRHNKTVLTCLENVTYVPSLFLEIWKSVEARSTSHYESPCWQSHLIAAVLCIVVPQQDCRIILHYGIPLPFLTDQW